MIAPVRRERATASVDIRVAHLDTPIDPAIAVAERAGTDRCGRLASPTDATPDSHGSVIAVEILRQAPAARIHTIGVLPDGEVIARIVQGLQWAVRRRPHVVCLALGIPAANLVLDRLVEDLVDGGALVVAAVGNDGAGRARRPALHPDVLSVGAGGPDGRVAPRSGSMFRPQSGVRVPDVVARSDLGTSFACASVAGVAACVWTVRPKARPGDVRAALVGTARAPAAEQSHRVLYGTLDPEAARTALRGGRPAAPPGRHRPIRGDGAPWVDPRLRRLLASASDDQPVRAVLAGDDTTVVELPASVLAVRLTQPGLVAASAPDVALVELASPPRMGS